MAGKLGKKIDTWEVSTEAGKFNILVYLGRGKHNVSHFTAICEGVTPRYFRTMESIQDLEHDARKEVKQRVGLKWERMILVETGARRKPQVDGWLGREVSSLEVDWQVIEVATRPDGKQLHRFLDRGSGYGTGPVDGLPQVKEFIDKDTNPWLEDAKRAIVLLPYTDANLRALGDLCEQLGLMAVKIAGIMGPQMAEKTLLGIQQEGVRKLGFSRASDDSIHDSQRADVGSTPGDPGCDQQADGGVDDRDRNRSGSNRPRSRRKSSAK